MVIQKYLLVLVDLVQRKTSENVELTSEDEGENLEKPYNYIDHEVDMQSIYGCEQMPILRKMSAKQVNRCDNSIIRNSYSLKEVTKYSGRYKRRLSSEDTHNHHIKPRKRWFESGSIDTINLGSAVDIFGQRAIDRNESKRLMHPFDRIVEEENKILEEMEVDDAETKRLQIIEEKK